MMLFDIGRFVSSTCLSVRSSKSKPLFVCLGELRAGSSIVSSKSTLCYNIFSNNNLKLRDCDRPMIKLFSLGGARFTTSVIPSAFHLKVAKC
jgi:hypothetical protein